MSDQKLSKGTYYSCQHQKLVKNECNTCKTERERERERESKNGFSWKSPWVIGGGIVIIVVLVAIIIYFLMRETYMFKETVITEREMTVGEMSLMSIHIAFDQLNRTLDNLITSITFEKADREKLLNVFKEILKQNQILVENHQKQTEQLIGLLGVINKKLLKLAPSNEALENGN